MSVYDPLTEDSAGSAQATLPKIQSQAVDFFYGKFQALHNVTFDIKANKVTALIGPSGCGKSTFLRCINRMNDEIDGAKMKGRILIDGLDIRRSSLDPVDLRRRVGMVFQKANPFPKSIFENVAFGPRRHGMRDRSEIEQIVEESLKLGALWNEVKDKLHQSAYSLSGGQQQRLCIARALAVKPKIILMDEPCSALDPGATSRIEDLIGELKREFTIVIVTHNMNQAQRACDDTGFFLDGRLIEFSSTEQLFMNPQKKETEDYISGRFG